MLPGARKGTCSPLAANEDVWMMMECVHRWRDTLSSHAMMWLLTRGWLCTPQARPSHPSALP